MLLYRGGAEAVGQLCARQGDEDLQETLRQAALPGLRARPHARHLSSFLGSRIEAEAGIHSCLLGNELPCELKVGWQPLEIHFSCFI